MRLPKRVGKFLTKGRVIVYGLLLIFALFTLLQALYYRSVSKAWRAAALLNQEIINQFQKQVDGLEYNAGNTSRLVGYSSHLGMYRIQFKYLSNWEVKTSGADFEYLQIVDIRDREKEVIIANLEAFGFSPYKNGSTRLWLLNELEARDNSNDQLIHYDYSDMKFEEVRLANGNRFLKVSNWPKGGELITKDEFYLGVQNGIGFYVAGNTEDQNIILQILSTIAVGKTNG